MKCWEIAKGLQEGQFKPGDRFEIRDKNILNPPDYAVVSDDGFLMWEIEDGGLRYVNVSKERNELKWTLIK